MGAKVMIHRYTLIAITAAIFAGCATQHAARQKEKNEREARRYASADVVKEVRDRIAADDLRFKGWQETAGSEKVFLPGIDEAQGKRLDLAPGVGAEAIQINQLAPFVTDNPSYEELCSAERDYMVRFNRALFQELEKTGRIPPNKPLVPTPGSAPPNGGAPGSGAAHL